MRRTLQTLLPLAILLVLVTVSFAQTSGEITGLVTDSSGAAVVGASVSVTNQATGAVRRVITNSEGIYAFPDRKSVV